jgi:hypothetical protein
MAKDLIVRVGTGGDALDLPATLMAAGAEAGPGFERVRRLPGVHLLLGGDRGYLVKLAEPLPAGAAERLKVGVKVQARFHLRLPVNRVIAGVSEQAPGATAALDLTAGLSGAAPLFLLPSGHLSATTDEPPTGMALLDTLVAAARWVSSRRASTFTRLFPPSAFHPDEPERTERLSATQAAALLDQLRGALATAAVGGEAARADARAAAQLRSAALTVLSHLVATAKDDPGFRAVADAAAAEIFALIEKEAAEPSLRAHAILLLQLRGPALSAADRDRAAALVRGLVRAAPPYAELKGAWNFAMCSGWDFHEGECDVLRTKYRFTDVPLPEGAPKPPGYGRYTVLLAPFATPHGDPIRVFARTAEPEDENLEMADPFFAGVMINRHAQLGAFDMQAVRTEVKQAGYKLMLNSQCAGLTTRFALSRMFPDADLYSSWDSTYFQTGEGGKVTASEGQDCFVAILQGMSKGETHAQIDARIRAAQWHHAQSAEPGFVQFVGPAHPLVLARYSDVNRDGRADLYDGFLDLDVKAIREDLRASATPRDPGVAPSAIGGEAADGLDWAAGSLDRVTQYSDLWAGLPGRAEMLYRFQAGGFYGPHDPPRDVPLGRRPGLEEDPATLPALCRYLPDADGGFRAEVMLHAHLSHSARELKRLLCAAEAMWRAFDLGYLPARGALADLPGQRGAVLLMLAGLLEFPADQNFIDGLWAMGLQMLRFPAISRSVVRGCITEADHDASNYYGSERGLTQLMGDGGDLHKADPAAWKKLQSNDPTIGRAAALAL